MTVSVIIPFYNLADYVRASLDSVVHARTVPNVSLEVVCVDDGSTDGTGDRLDAYAAAINGCRPDVCLRVMHKPNGGEGSARNAGCSIATGEWTAFLDGDDVWLPSVLTTFADVLARQGDADIVGFRFLPFVDGAMPPAARPATEPEVVFDIRREIPSEAIFDVGVFPTFFRRDRFRDIAFSDLPLGADRLYVAECLSHANRLVMSSAVVEGYRERAGSMARADWNARKIMSMIDFAAGSLGAFSASGKRVGRKGAAYLGDVLFSIAPKYMRRMTDDATPVRRYWREALSRVDGRYLSMWRRMKRTWL